MPDTYTLTALCEMLTNEALLEVNRIATFISESSGDEGEYRIYKAIANCTDKIIEYRAKNKQINLNPKG